MKNILKIENPKTHIFFAMALFLLSALTITFKGLSLGIDFRGGLNVYVDSSEISISELKGVLGDSGQNQAITEATNGVIKIVFPLDVDVNKFSKDLNLKKVSYEKVGPKVGEDLLKKSIISAFFVLLAVSAYVVFKFTAPFALSGILTLIHDTVVVLGLLSIIGVQFDITVFAAVLAIIGYTINDTIIVFDKVRSQLNLLSDNEDVLFNINKSVEAVFSRTIMTSLTTASVLVSLLFLGGESLFNFSLTLLIGVFVGTISSIFLSTSIICVIGNKDNLLIKEKNKPSQDGDL